MSIPALRITNLVIGCILFWQSLVVFFHNTAEASPRNSYVSIFISASPCQPYRAICIYMFGVPQTRTLSASPCQPHRAIHMLVFSLTHHHANNKNKNNAPPCKESLRIKHVFATPCTLLCVGYSISTLPSGSRARQSVLGVAQCPKVPQWQCPMLFWMIVTGAAWINGAETRE